MDLQTIDWFPIKLSFAVATAATVIALIAGSALAWLLARKRFPGTQPGRFPDHFAVGFAADCPGLLLVHDVGYSIWLGQISVRTVRHQTDIYGWRSNYCRHDSCAAARDQKSARCV